MGFETLKIIVNGVELPAPINMDYNFEDLDVDSERDVKNAKLSRNRIRADVMKVSLVYGIDDTATVSQVLKAISSETFSVELFDVKENKRTTKIMYAGPKTMQMVFYNKAWIKGLKFNLVEV